MTKSSGQQGVAQALEKQIAELKLQTGPVAREEIDRLQEQLDSLRGGSEAHEKDAWSRVLLARHPQRPYTLDFTSSCSLPSSPSFTVTADSATTPRSWVALPASMTGP